MRKEKDISQDNKQNLLKHARELVEKLKYE